MANPPPKDTVTIPYPRVPYSAFCPFDFLPNEVAKTPTQTRLHTHYGLAIQSIYGILGCDPSAGRTDVETVIKEILALGPGVNKQAIRIQSQRHRTRSLVRRQVEAVTLDFDELPGSMALVWDQVTPPGGADSAEIRVFNLTDATQMGLVNITVAGVQTLTLSSIPASGVKTLLLQHRVTGGVSVIRGATLFTGV